MGKCREREKELRRRRHRLWKRRKERIKQAILKARSCKLDHRDETFVSRFTFYDPETFVVVVERNERIDVGSEKERWLKEKGFYMTARFGR
jgi:hypothetical protein